MSLPIPPRYRWLKRIALALPIAIIALALLRWAWGAYAESQLNATIDRYRAAGEPVLPDDFARPGISDDQNAAKFLNKAVTAIAPGTYPNGLDLRDVGGDPRLVLDYPNETAAMLAGNAAALAGIRDARLAPACDWQAIPNVASFNGLVTSFSGLRGLAKLSLAAACAAHLNGDDAAAIAHLHDAISIAARTEEIGMAISLLVGIAIDALTAEVVKFIADELQDDSGWRYLNAASAPRARILDLIRKLNDDAAAQAAWEHAMRSERAYLLSALDDLCNSGGTGVPGATPGWDARMAALLLAPRWRLSAARQLDELSRLASIQLADEWVSRRVEREKAEATQRFRIGMDISFWLNPLDTDTMHPVAGLCVRRTATCRLAAVALAIRLFELDYGRRPPDLNALVPDYLPRVPADLFALDGQPLGYVPDSPRPCLYSVGMDGEDNHGTEPNSGDGYRVKGADILFDLDRKNIERPKWGTPPPTTVPATSQQAVQNQPQVEDGEAGDDQRQPAADEP